MERTGLTAKQSALFYGMFYGTAYECNKGSTEGVNMIYLDNSATTRQADEVTDVMIRTMQEDFGNPSSLHDLGLNAQNIVTGARRTVARSFGGSPEEVFFTSGGTEGDNTVLECVAHARKHQGSRIITTKVEHPAVLEACSRLEKEGFDVVYIGVDSKCRLDMEAFAEALNDDTILVSVMAVNNETGTIMPVRRIAEMSHQKGALFHTDAVQAYGKIPVDQTGADFVTISGHKIHGPKGIGAMYVKKGIHIPPFIVGGGQERGQRSGTENVPGIAGLGRAWELASEELQGIQRGGEDRMRTARERLLSGIRDSIDDILVNSPEDPAEGTSSVLNVSFLGTRGEVILHTLEEDGIYVSTGSACSSNKKGQSHVLGAMGLRPKEIEGALRFSFSRYNTAEEMDIVLDCLKKAVVRFRRLGSFR